MRVNNVPLKSAGWAFITTICAMAGCLASFAFAGPYRGPEVDKSLFVGTLTRTIVEGQKMTVSEIWAMEPACLVIGMGRATGTRWGMPPGTFKAGTEPKTTDYPMLQMTNGSGDAQWFHHYCWGELNRLRYNSAFRPAQKAEFLKRWEKQVNYVLSAARGTNWIYENKVRADLAAVQLATGTPTLAEDTARQVLSADVTLKDAHLTLVDALIAQKKTREAEDALKQALGVFGHDKNLVRRYKALTGTDPEPESDKVAQPQSTVPPPEPAVQPGVNASQAPIKDGSRDYPNNPASIRTPDIGTATNPYCRFCPTN